MKIPATPPRGREDYRHSSTVDSKKLLAVSRLAGFNGSFSKLNYAQQIAYTFWRLINFAYASSSSVFSTKNLTVYVNQARILQIELESCGWF